MSGKMEQFTLPAQRALALAQEAAERFHHNRIGTEHLLLGLMSENESVAGRVLLSLEVEPFKLLRMVKELTAAGQDSAETIPDLSSGTKQALELAITEAHQSGYQYVNTEHLLVALTHQPEEVAAKLLMNFGVTPDIVQQQVSFLSGRKRVKARRSAVRVPPATKLGSSRSQRVERYVMKILQMIGENKLTADQATELFEAFFPAFTLSSGQDIQFVCQFGPESKLERGQARMMIVYEATKTTLVERTFRLDILFDVLSDGFVPQSALRHQVVTAEFGDGTINAHLEFRVAEAET